MQEWNQLDPEGPLVKFFIPNNTSACIPIKTHYTVKPIDNDITTLKVVEAFKSFRVKTINHQGFKEQLLIAGITFFFFFAKQVLEPWFEQLMLGVITQILG